MAIIKKSEMKNLGKEETETKIVELKKELMKLNAQTARGTPAENPGKIRAIKRAISMLIHFSNKFNGGSVKTNE